MRSTLADQQGWLDASTLRIAFMVHSTHSKQALAAIVDTPASMFCRLRVIANGSCEIENIEQNARARA